MSFHTCSEFRKPTVMDKFIAFSYSAEAIKELLRDQESDLFGLLVKPIPFDVINTVNPYSVAEKAKMDDKASMSNSGDHKNKVRSTNSSNTVTLQIERVYSRVESRGISFYSAGLNALETESLEKTQRVLNLTDRVEGRPKVIDKSKLVPREEDKNQNARSTPNVEYQLEFEDVDPEYHFAFLSKHDLEILLPTAENIIISGCLLNVGEYAVRPLDSADNRESKEFFALKVEAEKRSLDTLGGNGLLSRILSILDIQDIVNALKKWGFILSGIIKFLGPKWPDTLTKYPIVLQNGIRAKSQRQANKVSNASTPEYDISNPDSVITGFIPDNCPPWWYFLSLASTKALRFKAIESILFGNSGSGKFFSFITPKFAYPFMSYVFSDQRYEDTLYRANEEIQKGWKEFAQSYGV